MSDGTEQFLDMAWIKWLGIEAREAGNGRAVIVLDPRPEQLNHNGTVNAAILFGLAEVAGAGAVVASILELAAASYTVVRRGTIDFLAPARGEILATGAIDDTDPDRLRAALELGDSIEIDADVEITDRDSRTVARSTMTVVLRPRRTPVPV